MILNLFFITFVTVYVIDYSGILIDISKTIYKILNPGKPYTYQLISKPFSCSTCMSLWLALGYLLIIGQHLIFSVFIAVVCGGFVVPIIKKLIELFYKIINKIN